MDIPPTRSVTGTKAREDLRRALRWLRRRCGDPSLSEIGQRCNLSQTTVHRIMTEPHKQRRDHLKNVILGLASFDKDVDPAQEFVFFKRLWALASAEEDGEEPGPEPAYVSDTSHLAHATNLSARPTLRPDQRGMDVEEDGYFVWTVKPRAPSSPDEGR
ncbi:hypothetical protein [Streptomyces sp. NPDC051109]|uniref:hypothetical protein n=1 Tax=Streptomyces sp. NPDC051109 TaxID=3365642 RepID=UPI0010656FAB